ncbi:MAG: DUF2721 domain-containing protein [Rhodocyclaceae bacterium]|nr:DUF2721 domain-containing protein [Rhodocyclaceae bacterium]
MAIDAVSHSIQLAVAPVFMLTAVGAMLSALAGRLARIIDRGRVLQDRMDALPEESLADQAHVFAELARLRKRGRIVNAAMMLLTLSAVFIGATVMTLFLVETAGAPTRTLVPYTFMGGIVCFVFALLCFLVETLLAGKALNFGRRPLKIRVSTTTEQKS